MRCFVLADVCSWRIFGDAAGELRRDTAVFNTWHICGIYNISRNIRGICTENNGYRIQSVLTDHFGFDGDRAYADQYFIVSRKKNNILFKKSLQKCKKYEKMTV